MNTPENPDHAQHPENTQNPEYPANLGNPQDQDNLESGGGREYPEVDPLVRVQFERELAAAADRLGRPVPQLQVITVGPPWEYVEADNGDGPDDEDGPDGPAVPWVRARTKLAGMPAQVREWSWIWAVAMASLPPRPAWVRRVNQVDHGLEAAGVTTVVYMLAALIAVVAGAPVMWLAWIGIGLTLGIIATQATLAILAIGHERHRVYAADQVALEHGHHIPGDTVVARALGWPRLTWPTNPLPGAYARWRRQTGGGPRRALRTTLPATPGTDSRGVASRHDRGDAR